MIDKNQIEPSTVRVRKDRVIATTVCGKIARLICLGPHMLWGTKTSRTWLDPKGTALVARRRLALP
jgi:hypothetical protein